MTDAMAHRGPDGRGVVTFPGDHRPVSGTGASRSSTRRPRARSRCRSPSAGGSPTTASSTTSASSAPSSRQRGERFASDCDTEVLLRLFALDGPAMLDAAQRDLRVRRLGRSRQEAVPRARPARRQAALLHAARRRLRVRVGAQGAPPARSAGPIARRDGARRLPHASLGARSEDGVPRASRSCLPGHYAWVDRDGDRRRTSTGISQFAPEERPEREWRRRGRRDGRTVRCAARW